MAAYFRSDLSPSNLHLSRSQQPRLNTLTKQSRILGASRFTHLLKQFSSEAQHRYRSPSKRRNRPGSRETRPLQTPRTRRQPKNPNRGQTHRAGPSFLHGIYISTITNPSLQATAGLLADGRQISNRARDEAASYHETYRAPPPLKVLSYSDMMYRNRVLTLAAQNIADRLGLYVQAYTLYSSVRPFGISTILGAIDNDGPALYVVEPSGVFYVRHLLFPHIVK